MFAFTSDTLVWKGQQKHFQLFSQRELLLDLRFLSQQEQECRFNGRSFFFERKGFWNPIYQVSEHRNQVMQLRHQFWGSKAFITLANQDGPLEMRYQNDPLLSLYITKDQEQIISYTLQIGTTNPPFRIELGNFMLDADHLLLLLALCFILTKDILSEYQGTGEELLLLFAGAA